MNITDVGTAWCEWGSGHYVVTDGETYEAECGDGVIRIVSADVSCDEGAVLIAENGEAQDVEMIRTVPSVCDDCDGSGIIHSTLNEQKPEPCPECGEIPPNATSNRDDDAKTP